MFRNILLTLSMIVCFSIHAESHHPKDIETIKNEIKNKEERQKERHVVFKLMAGTMQAFEKHPFILSILPTVVSVATTELLLQRLLKRHIEPLSVAVSVYAGSVICSKFLLPYIMLQLEIPQIK